MINDEQFEVGAIFPAERLGFSVVGPCKLLIYRQLCLNAKPDNMLPFLICLPLVIDDFGCFVQWSAQD
jgi:hypothetical protein